MFFSRFYFYSCFLDMYYFILVKGPEISSLRFLFTQALLGMSPISWVTSRQLSYWLVIHTSFVITLYQRILYFKAGQYCIPKGLWLGWCLCSMFSSIHNTFLYQRHWHIGLRHYEGISLTSLHSMSYGGDVFNYRALPSVCGNKSTVLT